MIKTVTYKDIMKLTPQERKEFLDWVWDSNAREYKLRKRKKRIAKQIESEVEDELPTS